MATLNNRNAIVDRLIHVSKEKVVIGERIAELTVRANISAALIVRHLVLLPLITY
jgi:hypothetical protein